MAFALGQTVCRKAVEYWSGDSGFLPALLINLALLRLILSTLQQGLPRDIGTIALFAWAGANLIIAVWQFGGAVRLVSKQKGTAIDENTLWVGWGIIFATFVISANQALDLVTINSPDREAILMQNYAPPTLPISKDGTTVFIKGDLDYKQNTGLIGAIENHSNLKTVNLESDGGLVYAARALARNILKAGLDTHVETHCSSSCTLVFAAGNNRTLSKAAKLGFHKYGLISRFHNSTVKLSEEESRDRDFFLARGITADFVSRIFLAPHDQMWFPTVGELQSNKVISENTMQ